MSYAAAPRDQKPELTNTFIKRNVPLATRARRQYDVHDKQNGFFLRVGLTKWTWMVRVDVPDPLKGHKTLKEKIGEWPLMERPEAIKRALAKIVELRERGAQKRKAGPTLRQGWAEYRDELIRKKRSFETIRSYTMSVETRLPDYIPLDTPLRNLGEPDAWDKISEAHLKMSEDRGPLAANRAFETLRSIYYYCQELYPQALPAANPCVKVFWKDEPEGEPLDDEQLRAFWMANDGAGETSEVRRAYCMFLLLSGGRATATAALRWADLDVKRRLLYIPNPKGGERKAFYMPPSRQMLAVLNWAKRAGRVYDSNLARHVIFPGDSKKATKEEKADAPLGYEGRGWHVQPTGRHIACKLHALRHTYMQWVRRVGVPEFYHGALMNHAPMSQTGRYGRGRPPPELIAYQEKVSRALMKLRETK